MWIWLETNTGQKLKVKITNDILRRSRKRGLTISYTTQTLEQVPPRIKKINDFIAYPILSKGHSKCKLLLFAGPRGKPLLKQFMFYARPIWDMYSTNEEVSDLMDDVSGTGQKNEIIEGLRLDPIGKKPVAAQPIFPQADNHIPLLNPIQEGIDSLRSDIMEKKRLKAEEEMSSLALFRQKLAPQASQLGLTGVTPLDIPVGAEDILLGNRLKDITMRDVEGGAVEPPIDEKDKVQ